MQNIAENRRIDTLIALGRAKLARGMRTLLNTNPFHGHVAAGWRARPETAIATMGVSWAFGGIQLVWNPKFVSHLTDIELAGVLAHEVHHVVLRHPFLFPEQAKPGPDFDLHAAIVAEEITANEFVGLPLPGKPLLLEDFAERHPQLAPLQSTRERYRLLFDASRARHHHEERERLKKTIQEQMKELISALQTAGGGHAPDSHDGWESFRTAGTAAALAVSVATAQALARHGHTLSSEVRQLIQSVHASFGGAPGTTSEGAIEKLAGIARARLSWQKILRRLLAVDQQVEPTYLRPPRRFPEFVGVLPSTRRVPAKLRILAAVDTSGSMSAGTLDEIAAELRVMACSYDVSVVEFDMAIQRRYRLEASGGPRQQAGSVKQAGPEQQVVLDGASTNATFCDPLSAMQGRGGTSFFPVFERTTLDWAADGGDLSGVIVFSDGFGPAPSRPPREPVIWVLMGHGVRKPAEWGSIVNTTGGASETAD
jgi:predicted metal-dependent peptidase